MDRKTLDVLLCCRANSADIDNDTRRSLFDSLRSRQPKRQGRCRACGHDGQRFVFAFLVDVLWGDDPDKLFETALASYDANVSAVDSNVAFADGKIRGEGFDPAKIRWHPAQALACFCDSCARRRDLLSLASLCKLIVERRWDKICARSESLPNWALHVAIDAVKRDKNISLETYFHVKRECMYVLTSRCKDVASLSDE